MSSNNMRLSSHDVRIFFSQIQHVSYLINRGVRLQPNNILERIINDIDLQEAHTFEYNVIIRLKISTNQSFRIKSIHGIT